MQGINGFPYYFCEMKCRILLLNFLLLPFTILNAQPSGKNKGSATKKGINHSQNSNIHHPKKPGVNISTKNKGLSKSLPKSGNNISSLKNSNTPNKISSKENNVTGIWKGYFVQSTFGFEEEKYRFEVQVAEQDNHSLTAVTYSYKTTVFYGKAEATGIFTAKSKNFLLKETKLTDVKIIDKNSAACLMTCYLDFDKVGKLETLTGEYTSVSMKDKSDCGSGKIFLEKSPVTDFYKEEFLVKRENELKKKGLSKKSTGGDKIAKLSPSAKSGLKPGAEENLTKNTKPIKPIPEQVEISKKSDSAKPSPPVVIKTFPKPEILKTRENELVKTIVTDEKEFKVELYDNGEIDGDRISVYHNNELIVSNKMLSDKPITFTIKADGVPIHEFVMVAENLGTIPPNTSLMIITAGKQRYELFVTSTEQKNAVVRVEYKDDNKDSNK